MDDQVLVKSLKRGELEAFDRLFEKYSQRIYLFALAYRHDETESEEVVQEVFMKVWERRKFLKPELSFKSYVFTIASNAIRKSLIKKLRRETALEDLSDVAPSKELTRDQVHYRELRKQLDHLIELLPEKRREIFKMSRKEGLSYKEISSQLNISERTVENQIAKALKFLRKNVDI